MCSLGANFLVNLGVVERAESMGQSSSSAPSHCVTLEDVPHLYEPQGKMGRMPPPRRAWGADFPRGRGSGSQILGQAPASQIAMVEREA